MKTNTLYLISLVVGLSIFIVTCKQSQETVAPPQPIVPVITPVISTSIIAPQILEMAIAELPNPKGIIDEQKKEITFTFPETLQSLNLNFSYKLSADAGKVVLLRDQNNGIRGLDDRTTRSVTDILFKCSAAEGCMSVVVGYGTNNTSTYKVIFKPAGPLKVSIKERAHFTTSTTTDIVLNLQNIVGNSLIAGFTLLASDGSEVLRQSFNFDHFMFQQSEYYKSLNRWYIPLQKSLPNGNYTLKINLLDGTSVTAIDPVRVEGPTIRLGNSCTGMNIPADIARLAWPNASSQTQLSLADNVSLEVSNRNQQTHEFKIVESIRFYYDRNPSLISEPVNGQLKPGNYTVKVLVNGQVTSECYPLSVLRYTDQPYINTIGCNARTDCDDRTPISLKQGQLVILGLPYYVFSWEKDPKYFSATLSRAKLIDVNDPNHIEYAPVTLPRAVEHNPTLTLPADLKPGRYQLIFQIGYGSEILESEPFIRDVEVK